MAKAISTSKTRLAEINLQLVTYQERLEKYTGKNLPTTKGNIVAFLGPTKAGKSTLINCISQNPLICKSDIALGTYYFEKPDNVNGPEIGGAGESHTTYPEKFQTIPGTTFDMWDFPGFGDNKGTEQEISNAVCYEAVLRPQISVRFVLVVPKELVISDDPMPFYKLLSDLQKISSKISKSLCIVVSKFERGSLKEILKNKLRYEFSNTNATNSNIVSVGKMVIETILRKRNFIEFRAPLTEHFVFENRELLVDMIKNLTGAKISEFPLVIGDQAKKEILELYTLFNKEMSSQVDKTNKLLKIFFDKDFETANEILSAESKWDILQKTQKKIKNIIKFSDNFDKFFAEIEAYGFGIEKFADCLKKFLFIEKLKNRYNGKSTKSSETDYLNSIKITLEDCLTKCETLIKTVGHLLDEIRELKEKEKKYERTYSSSSSSSSSSESDSSTNKSKGNQPNNSDEKDSLLVATAKVLDRVFETIIKPPRIEIPKPICFPEFKFK